MHCENHFTEFAAIWSFDPFNLQTKYYNEMSDS